MPGNTSDSAKARQELTDFIAKSMTREVVGMTFPPPGHAAFDEPKEIRSRDRVVERLANKSQCELEYLAGMRFLAGRYGNKAVESFRQASTTSLRARENYRSDPSARRRAREVGAEAFEAIGVAYYSSEKPEDARKGFDAFRTSVEAWDKLGMKDEGARARCRYGLALLRTPPESPMESRWMKTTAALLLEEARALADPEGLLRGGRPASPGQPLTEAQGHLLTLEASLLELEQPKRARDYWATAGRAFAQNDMPKAARQARQHMGLTAAQTATPSRTGPSISNWLAL